MFKTMIEFNGYLLPFYTAHKNHLFNIINKYRTFYELETLQYMIKILEPLPGAIKQVVDVGANVGNHSLYFAQFLTYVHAFEPQPDLCEVFEKNLEGCDNVTLHRCALGDKLGFGEMVYPKGRESDHTAEVETHGGSIPINTLDAYDIPADLIKIDVEGAELKVLKGAMATIINNKPELFIECATDEAFETISEYLAPIGYNPIKVFGAKGGFTPMWHFSHKP